MKKLLSLSRLLVVSAVVAVSGAVTAYADSRPDLVIAINAPPRSLEPGLRTGNVDVRVSYSVFDTLIKRDFVHEEKTGEVKLVPGLATSWKMVKPNVMELKLRQGVKWHDGTEFTADDVTFSFGKERVFGKKAAVRRAKNFIGPMTKVEALDKYTVRITWKQADPIIEHRLSGYTSWIVQRANYERFKKGDEAANKWMKKAAKGVAWQPVGTGPYKLVEYKAGEHLKFAANDAYWMGKPAAKTVTFKVVPEVSARIAGLVSGEFDIAVEIPPDQLPVIDRYKNLKKESKVIQNSHVLVFNDTHPVLKNKKLRQAMVLGIDRTKLVAALWDNMTMTPNGNQMKVYGEYYIKDFPEFAYDKARAAQMVKESGYKGEEIAYRIIPNYYTNSMQAAQVIQQMWKEIGVNVKITPVENWKAVRAKGAAIYPWSNTVRWPDPIGQLVMSWGPKSAVQRKYKFWQGTKEFTKLTKTLETSLDTSERRNAFRRMMEIWREEVPGTILYNPVSTYAMSDKVQFTPYALYYMDLRPDNLKIEPKS